MIENSVIFDSDLLYYYNVYEKWINSGNTNIDENNVC